MGFVILFAAAWLSVFMFYSMKKSLSLLENTFVFLMMLTIGIHLNWVVVEELKYVTSTEDGLLYAGLMSYRLITMPMIFVLMANGIGRSRTWARAYLTLGAAFAALLSLWVIMMAYEVVVNVKWNLFYEALYIAALQALCLLLLKLYRRQLGREASAA